MTNGTEPGCRARFIGGTPPNGPSSTSVSPPPLNVIPPLVKLTAAPPSLRIARSQERGGRFADALAASLDRSQSAGGFLELVIEHEGVERDANRIGLLSRLLWHAAVCEAGSLT